MRTTVDAFEGITDSEICAGALLPLNKSMPLSNRPLTIGLPQIGWVIALMLAIPLFHVLHKIPWGPFELLCVSCLNYSLGLLRIIVLSNWLMSSLVAWTPIDPVILSGWVSTSGTIWICRWLRDMASAAIFNTPGKCVAFNIMSYCVPKKCRQRSKCMISQHLVVLVRNISTRAELSHCTCLSWPCMRLWEFQTGSSPLMPDLSESQHADGCSEPVALLMLTHQSFCVKKVRPGTITLVAWANLPMKHRNSCFVCEAFSFHSEN